MKQLLPRLQDILFAVLLFSASMQGMSMLNTDGDLGRHITIGNYIIQNGKIPTRDIFSHTMTGERLVPHEWLAQVAFGGINQLGGLNGIVFLVSVIIALTFVITYRRMLKDDTSRVIAFITVILAAFASNLHWLTRPHIFTFLFAAVWVTLLENKTTRLWLFPLVMLVWANTHGAFIAGFAIWAAFFAGWLWDYLRKEEEKATGMRLLTIGTASFIATFLNPVGWRLWDTSVGYFGNHFLVDKTIEYQSPNFHISSTWPFLIMLVLFFLLHGFDGRLKMRETFLLAGWGALSLYNTRNIPLFAIVVAPYLAKLVQSAVRDGKLWNRLEPNIRRIEGDLRGHGFNLIAVILICISTLSNPANQFNPKAFPVDAVNWLKSNPQEGNMYNFFTWGGYLLYRLWPEQRVFLDGQTDFYGEALSREYVQVESLQTGWEKVLAKHNVTWVITQSGQPLLSALKAKGWILLYQDDTAVIVRAPAD